MYLGRQIHSRGRRKESSSSRLDASETPHLSRDERFLSDHYDDFHRYNSQHPDQSRPQPVHQSRGKISHSRATSRNNIPQNPSSNIRLPAIRSTFKAPATKKPSFRQASPAITTKRHVHSSTQQQHGALPPLVERINKNKNSSIREKFQAINKSSNGLHKSTNRTNSDSHSPAEQKPARLAPLAERMKKYQNYKVIGTSSWRIKAKKTRKTANSTARGNNTKSGDVQPKTSSKMSVVQQKKQKVTKTKRAAANIEEEVDDPLRSSMDLYLDTLEFDGDAICRSETQLVEVGSEYDPVTPTPRSLSPVDYSYKHILTLDPNPKAPSRIPVPNRDVGSIIPPRAPVYPHPLRYFAGELMEKERNKSERKIHRVHKEGGDDRMRGDLSPRRPLDVFEQTMLELQDPSAPSTKPFFISHQASNMCENSKHEESVIAHKPQIHKVKPSQKITRKIYISRSNWWIKELEFIRKTHNEHSENVDESNKNAAFMHTHSASNDDILNLVGRFTENDRSSPIQIGDSSCAECRSNLSWG